MCIHTGKHIHVLTHVCIYIHFYNCLCAFINQEFSMCPIPIQCHPRFTYSYFYPFVLLYLLHHGQPVSITLSLLSYLIDVLIFNQSAITAATLSHVYKLLTSLGPSLTLGPLPESPPYPKYPFLASQLHQ